jgi:tRNA pseudouridine55 synthase
VSERRPTGTGLDGVLVVAKPAGPTSHDVVALVRRLAATRRVGHGGTLDPFATGVLPVFLGRATRLVEYHARDRKAYRATICFGASSTTDDPEGELTPHDGEGPNRERVEAALAAMTGTHLQRPPAFSAVKVAGRRAYARARAGETVDLASRSVVIDEIRLLDWDGRDARRPVAVIDVRCSAGTYVRALARDLGAAVDNAAYLGALVRTASGPFELADATDLDAIRAAAAEGGDALARMLLPSDTGLDLPRVTLTASEVADVSRGRFIRPVGGVPPGEPGPLRLIAPDGRLVAVATARDGRLAPDKVFVGPGDD